MKGTIHIQKLCKDYNLVILLSTTADFKLLNEGGNLLKK